MKTLDLNMKCPACTQEMHPKVVVCSSCDVRVEGHFVPNEFAKLDGDDLHLLRIFVHSEGRIRDMESALGLSYPTIRNRLAQLRSRLGLDATLSEVPAENPSNEENSPSTPKKLSEMTSSEALAALQRGELNFEEALKKIKKGKKT